jgi:hypothetical protein
MSKSKAIIDMPGKGGLATEARDMVSKPLASGHIDLGRDLGAAVLAASMTLKDCGS